MLLPTRNVLKRTLMISVAATRGGPFRLEILAALKKRPMNVNQIARAFGVDYKTAQHHVRVLEKSSLIVSKKSTYDNAFSLSILLRSNIDILDELGKGK